LEKNHGFTIGTFVNIVLLFIHVIH